VGLNTHDFLYKSPTLCGLFFIFPIWDWGVTRAGYCDESQAEVGGGNPSRSSLACSTVHCVRLRMQKERKSACDGRRRRKCDSKKGTQNLPLNGRVGLGKPNGCTSWKTPLSFTAQVVATSTQTRPFKFPKRKNETKFRSDDVQKGLDNALNHTAQDLKMKDKNEIGQ
jgi:hypothetical protein